MTRDDHLFHLEETFHRNNRRSDRKERKRVSTRDRSRFKKSDQDQLKKQTSGPLLPARLLKGRVLAITPQGIMVESGLTYHVCSLKGSLKLEKKRMKNLIAIGDFVQFDDVGNGQGVIYQVDERFSILSRADNLSRNREQLIAVNIDQVLITCSVLAPPLKPFLVDRYIIASQKGKMLPLIVVNKIDLLSHPQETIDRLHWEKEYLLYKEFMTTYRALGIRVLPVSTKTGEGIDSLKEAMEGKTSVFSGQSGTGKSSLINSVTSSSLATGSVVRSTHKGSHTTTAAQLIVLEKGGFCIDTPGIKSFGLWDLEVEDLAAYFSEIVEHSAGCRYANCTHLVEPECAVHQCVEEGKISPLRFASYSALMTSLAEEHRHR